MPDLREEYTSVLSTYDQAAVFIAAATQHLGDPAEAVALMLFQWSEGQVTEAVDIEDNLRAYWSALERALMLKVYTPEGPVVLPVPISRHGRPVIGAQGTEAYGLRRLGPDSWAMSPSLNIPGVLHAFVVLYGVPDPAPWLQSSIIITG